MLHAAPLGVTQCNTSEVESGEASNGCCKKCYCFTVTCIYSKEVSLRGFPFVIMSEGAEEAAGIASFDPARLDFKTSTKPPP